MGKSIGKQRLDCVVQKVSIQDDYGSPTNI